MNMKFAITGATGFVGSNLISFLEKNGHGTVPVLRGDFADTEQLAAKLAGADAVVNLAGAPIVARWTQNHMKTLKESRIQTARKLVSALEHALPKPAVLVSASAVGLYPDFRRQTENSFTVKHDFLAALCEEWETAAREAESLRIRTVILRFGAVLGKGGGMIKKIRIPFFLGLGGRIASGKQGFSWIHIEDLCRLILFVAEKGGSGVYNAVSPNPTDNICFTRTLARVLHRPAILPVPEFALKLLFGKGARVLTSGQIVLPERALQEGFTFHYPTLKDALSKIFI
ncbi:MAG: TIGR01777 family protein [Acidobacteria bacterium]|nr:TIGR01777 family protein [Acidobacteriota bacterium]